MSHFLPRARRQGLLDAASSGDYEDALGQRAPPRSHDSSADQEFAEEERREARAPRPPHPPPLPPRVSPHELGGEFGIQLAVAIPLAYLCFCTYYSTFCLGGFSFYSLVPRWEF